MFEIKIYIRCLSKYGPCDFTCPNDMYIRLLLIKFAIEDTNICSCPHANPEMPVYYDYMSKGLLGTMHEISDVNKFTFFNE